MQTVAEFGSTPQHPGLILTGKGDHCYIGKGRAVLHPAQLQLRFIKAVVILLCRQTDDLVLRHQGLDHSLSGRVAPACPAYHLGQHIEGGLMGPEAIVIKAHIRIQHTHQSDLR